MPYRLNKPITRLSHRTTLYMKIHPVLSLAHLEPAPNTPGPFHRELPKPPAVVDAEVYPDEDDIYEVERLLDKRTVRRGRKRTPYVEYLVRWKGYGPEDHQWVREDDLQGSPDLIEAFNQRDRPT
ncbi:hypothetical protein IFM61606_02753 [Aspergillus udagawae]|nr:hypothetical protein IFM51744_03055 [Aspergillus udagawae]GFG22884.1 hypothetical protein IFM61606_02753 [Aspergillus udagawae]